MKKIYNPDKPIKSMKDLRLEKLKIQIETMYLEDELKKQMDKYLNNGFVHGGKLGSSFVGNLTKWLIYYKSVSKLFHWFKDKFHKKTAK